MLLVEFLKTQITVEVGMSRVIQIGNSLIGDDQPVALVAELGINPNGSVNVAKQLIDVVVKNGVRFVKFQKRTVSVVYSAQELATSRVVPRELLENAIRRGVLPEENVQRLLESDFQQTTNGDLKYALEFSADEYGEIDVYCRKRGIVWFASPWDEESVDFLGQFNPPCYKVASASLTDDALLRNIRSKGRPVILSTGMSDMAMVRNAVGVLGTGNLVLMHCTSYYQPPVAGQDDIGLRILNLNAIHTLRKEFPSVPVGFSNHVPGIMPSYAAAAMGACMVEIHLTLNRAMWGSDQASSLDPLMFGNLARALRELHIAKGDGVKVVYPEEVLVAKKLRRK